MFIRNIYDFYKYFELFFCLNQQKKSNNRTETNIYSHFLLIKYAKSQKIEHKSPEQKSKNVDNGKI